ncbi:NUDIX hydrolase [Paenibacillus sp. N3/727]|uniref:NUDIX hydrolase n=1 Tax=Paenibacillus sp. N3/727 TaxID=2925845 RepID=UPI001F53AF57|nr:NUDIX hydrolase [Paenibacillus sp. N3/727]UNK16830.1 NUDIX hydrolase [Paenibacillus sp. N3/727]
MTQKWLEWAKEIQAISQAGLAYSKDVYDKERFEQLRELSVSILHEYTDMKHEKIRTLFASDTGYPTPKVDVRGVVFQEGEILLVKERLDGVWALPGGWADIGLSAKEVVVKEIKEESGYDARPVRLLAVLDKKFHNHPPASQHVYKMFIQCELTGGEAAGGVETSEVGFFSENNLPELSLERNSKEQLQQMFEYLRNPAKDVWFD